MASLSDPLFREVDLELEVVFLDDRDADWDFLAVAMCSPVETYKGEGPTRWAIVVRVPTRLPRSRGT